MTIELSVPFRDKDIVKHLGARWDAVRRCWTVPEGAPKERFDRWIPKTGKGSVIVSESESVKGELIKSPSNMIKEADTAQLSTVLFEVSEAVRRLNKAPRWVAAEIASVRKAASGHYYFELVEHDSTGKEIAKAMGRLWSSNGKVIKKFERFTGGELCAGIKIKFLANIDFSIQYGLGFIIEDIDPSWTLGDMQNKVMIIRQQLEDEKIFGLNKNLDLPRDFYRVALIAPESAAGLGDFLADAKFLEQFGLCSFDIFGATFEGVTAKQSILNAFDQVQHEMEQVEYDCVVMIRGGGATTSLNWLNELEIAKRICTFSLPIFVGIGHERDSTILDEVASVKFDTPSKVIGHIFSIVIQQASLAKQLSMSIFDSAEQVVVETKLRVQGALDTVELSARATVLQSQQMIDQLKKEVMTQAMSSISESQKLVESLMREVVGLGPTGVLSRGYAVIQSANGDVITKSQGITDGQIVNIKMSDGQFVAQVKLNEKS